MKKLILLLFTLFLTACTVDPNFTSPPTGNKRTDFLNQAQKTIATIGAKYGYECKRGTSPGKGSQTGVYERGYHFDISSYARLKIYLDSYCEATLINITYHYFEPDNNDFVDPNALKINTELISELINALTDDEISVDDLNKFIDPNNESHKITDEETLELYSSEIYKYIEFDQTGYHNMECRFYNPYYSLYYNGIILLEEETNQCE